jgi:hypothetical protein
MQHRSPPAYSHSAGSYFRMFPVAPAHYERAQLLAVVDAINNRAVTIHDPSATPAGYTYLGQFIDHEITHMVHLEALPGEQVLPVESLQQRRNCAFDLDSLYGMGLDDRRVPYTDDGCFHSEFTRNGHLYDLPRGGVNGYEARIAEYHNDENFIVAQMQVLFMNAHNRLMRHYAADIGDVRERFRQARKELALLLQALVINDFLPQFLDRHIYQVFFGQDGAIANGESGLLTGITPANAGIPVEFAGAAYRFGHSLVRGSYPLNDVYHFPVSLPALFGLTGKGGLRNLETGEPGTDLEPYAIDWKYYFAMDYPDYSNAFTLKPKIADQLRKLANEAPGHQDLLLRNLLRGRELGLPAAQGLGEWLQQHQHSYCELLRFEQLSEAQVRSHDLGPVLAAQGIATQVPLWLYVLMEPAFNDSSHSRLGKLGSLILAETFRMLLRCSSPSLLELSRSGTELTALHQHYPVCAVLLSGNGRSSLGGLMRRFITFVNHRS